MDNSTKEVLLKAKNKIELMERENNNLRENLKAVIGENKFILSEIEGMEQELKLLEKEKNKVNYEKEKLEVDKEVYNEQRLQYERYKNKVSILEEKVKILTKDKQRLLNQQNNKEDIERLNEIIRALIENQESQENEKIEINLNKSIESMQRLEDIVDVLQREKEQIKESLLKNESVLKDIQKNNEKKFSNIKNQGIKEKDNYIGQYFKKKYDEDLLGQNSIYESRDFLQDDFSKYNKTNYAKAENEKLEYEIHELKNQVDFLEERETTPNYFSSVKNNNQGLEEEYLDFTQGKKSSKSDIELKIEQLKKENEALNLEQMKLKGELKDRI